MREGVGLALLLPLPQELGNAWYRGGGMLALTAGGGVSFDHKG
jgi:hypothetical protein